jgi:hypothetical protein
MRYALAIVAASAGAAAADIDVGVRVDGIPDGSVREGRDGTTSVDLPRGHAVGGELRYATGAYAIGLAPRYVRFGDHEAPDHELDLAVRITGRRPISPDDGFELSFALGYSFVPVAGTSAEFPDGLDTEGFVVGTAAAYARRVHDRLSVLVEAGYQYGFQARSYWIDPPFPGGGYHVREAVAPRFVHAGVGVRAHF